MLRIHKNHLATACWPLSMYVANFFSCHPNFTWGENESWWGVFQEYQVYVYNSEKFNKNQDLIDATVAFIYMSPHNVHRITSFTALNAFALTQYGIEVCQGLFIQYKILCIQSGYWMAAILKDFLFLSGHQENSL